MPRRISILVTVLILLSLVLAPSAPARADQPRQGSQPPGDRDLPFIAESGPYCPDIDPYVAGLPEYRDLLPPECLAKYESLLQPAEVQESSVEAEPDATDPFEKFGYHYDDTAPFNWISAETESSLFGDNVASGPVDIGFAFPFYGIPYTQLYFSTNGLITFGAPYAAPPPQGMEGIRGMHGPPTNMIAAGWSDLIIGGLHPTGAIYYSRGGTAPNRYFVVEWRDAYHLYYYNTPFNFEAILHENGDISVQIIFVPAGGVSRFLPRTGLKDMNAESTYEYYHYSNPPSEKHILFSYPAPAPRVFVNLEDSHPLVARNASVEYHFTVYNTGAQGADTYDLGMENLDWPYELLSSAPGNPPLTDTDSDGKVDTGAVPQSASVQVIARVTVPEYSLEGAQEVGTLVATSSLKTTVKDSADFSMRVPAPFVSVFGEGADGSMGFLQLDEDVINESLPGPAGTYGYYPAVAEMPNGNYFYVWENLLPVGGTPVTLIQYSIVGRDGTAFMPVKTVPNNTKGNAIYMDQSPSVAVTPDGTMGVVWRRVTINKSTNLRNTNIFLATFNWQGKLLTGPADVTNDPYWGGLEFDAYKIYTSPSIAATTNNNFVIAWQDWYGGSRILYAVRSKTGALVRDLTMMPPVHTTWAETPVLNSLNGGKVIFTWDCGQYGPCFSVVNNAGDIVKSPASLRISGNTTYGSGGWYADAVQLPNGNIAVAWTSGGLEYAVLNSSFNRIYDLTPSSGSNISKDDRVSITTDGHGHVIMSVAGSLWNSNYRVLYYALATPGDYNFTLEPIGYHLSPAFHLPNINGQGIARYREVTPLPGAINKTGPANGANKVALDPVISWSSTPLAAYYQYCYDTIDDGVCNTSWSAPTIQTSARLPVLEHQTTYYWQVRAVSAGGTVFANGSEGATWSFTTTDLLIPGWVGSVSVTSDRALVSVGRPHVGAEVASYDGFSAGGLTAYAPMLFKDSFGGSYDAALYVQNVDDSHTASITIKFYDSAGTLSCTKTDSIAPLASKGYWMPAESCLPAGWVGGAVVTSDYNIVTVGRPHAGSEVMTYNGFSAGSTSAYLPMLFKHAFGGSYDSAFYVQNVDDAHTATLSIKFYDSAGTLTCELPETVAPLASKGWWVPDQSCLPEGWVGGAVITSDWPIVTIGRPHAGAQVTAYSGFPAGGPSMYVPMLFKHAFGGSYDAAFYVQNVDPAQSADITIQFYDSAGNLTCDTTDSLAPLASKGWWVPDQSCLPADWVGGAVVTSNRDIVAVGRPHVGAQVTTYPGLASGSTGLFLPMLFNHAFGGSYDSAFYLQNTDAADPADVTLKFYDADGNLSCTHNDVIPAKATLGFWTPAVTCLP